MRRGALLTQREAQGGRAFLLRLLEQGAGLVGLALAVPHRGVDALGVEELRVRAALDE